MKDIRKTWFRYFIPIVLVLLVLMTLCVRCSSEDSLRQDESEENVYDEADGNIEDDRIPTVVFPYDMELGRLSVISLFQSDVPNPDKDFEEGKNLATIELINKSEQYLLYADVVLTMMDGTKLNFRVEDLPAGKKVWAFELSNIAIEAEASCISISCTAEFAETDSDWNTRFQTETEAAQVKITNLTAEKITGLEVTFHCLMEDTYFGGLSYKYGIEELVPDTPAQLEVLECYFGDAEVVMIEP